MQQSGSPPITKAHLFSVITEALGDVVQALDTGASLDAVTHPLIKALEAIPGAGRFAIFIAHDRASPLECLAAPSLADTVTSQIIHMLETNWRQTEHDHLPEAIKIDDAAGMEARLFPLRLGRPGPDAVLVTVRTISDPTTHTADEIDALIDQIARLADYIIEDRILRNTIRDQEAMTQGLITIAPDAIIRIRQDGTVVAFTGRAPDMFGYAPDEIVGQSVEALMPAEQAREHNHYIENFLSSGKRQLRDYGRRLQAVHKTGREFPIELALSQIRLGEEIQFLGIIRDISRRVEREKEIMKMQAAIAKASQQSALGDLAATLGHELGQPMTAIANYMDALELKLSSLPADEARPLKDLASKASAQARLGGEIIRRVLRMSRQTEGEQTLGDLHVAVEESVAAFQTTAQRHGISLSFEQVGEPRSVQFDRVQIYQAVANFISNAIQYVDNQTEKVITVTSVLSDDMAEISVCDTGPGVPGELKDTIFDSYTTTRTGGLGLGLAVVKRIAEDHKGAVLVKDRPEGGACFWLQFPAPQLESH